MKTTDKLRRDHQLIRRQMQFVEAALREAPGEKFALSEMCFLLVGMLETHIARKRELLAPFLAALKDVPAGCAIEGRYGRPQAVVREVNGMLSGGGKTPTEGLRAKLDVLVSDIQAQMGQEERELYPAIDALEAPRRFESGALQRGQTRQWIHEEMTVNAILRTHPESRGVFSTFAVDCDRDGCHCVEELRWRRGVDVDALILKLRLACN